MTDTDFHLEKFIGFLGGKSNVTEGSNENALESIEPSLFPQTKDYDNLKNLLRNGQKDMAKSCIENGCRLNKHYDHSFDGSPLHLAVSLEYSDIVGLLLEKGASTDSKNDNDETPLMLAAIIGNSQIIDMLLLKTSPDYYSSDMDFTYFHIACMQNNVDIVRKFFVSDMNINKPVEDKSLFWPGFTPLHFAVEFKCMATAKFLIENGADITKQDKRGMSPLHLAFRKRNRVLIDIILSVQYYFASNPVDPEGLSHFQIACAMNKQDIVEDFLEKDIQIESSTKNRHYLSSCNFAMNNECIGVLECLLQCNAFTDDKDNYSIVDSAYTVRNEEILKLIITSFELDMVNVQSSPVKAVTSTNEKKANHCITNSSKSIIDKFDHIKKFKISEYSELHVAVLQNKMEQVNAILEENHPAIVTVKDARGKTPLHLAFKRKEEDLVNQLLSLHLELKENPVDNDNLSHFHISCTTKNVTIVEDFIKKGVDINMTIDMNSLVWAGNTPLHLAMMFGRLDIVQLLLNNGADFTLKNKAGKSSYDLAISSDTFLSNDYNEDYEEWEFIEKILLANERRKIDDFDDRGITLLHVASAINNVDMIKRYANADTINKTIDESLKRWPGYTALHLATCYEAEDAIKTLLNCGADPTIEDCEDRMATRLVGNYIGDKFCLISKNVYDDQGFSTFHAVCQSGNEKAAEHFLRMGIDVNERVPHNCSRITNVYEGETPLHLAVASGNPEIVKFLLENGANVNARNCYFDTPLHFCENSRVLKILLDYGADPEALNCHWDTALGHKLFHSDEQNFLTAVIESGWDISRWNNSLTNKFELENLTVAANHIQRLYALGTNLSEENTTLYNSLLEKYSMIRINHIQIKEKCLIELESMKGIQIDSRTRLYDILLKSPSEMIVYCRNETFQKIVESEQELRQKYPIYAYLVILQFKRGLKRTNLVEEGKKSLSSLTNRWMGDLILETILQFLNDYELTYLNYAASGQNIFQ